MTEDDRDMLLKIREAASKPAALVRIKCRDCVLVVWYVGGNALDTIRIGNN